MARTLYTGNVIESPSGDKWIVTNVDETCVSAVSFDSENCSAVQRLDDWVDTRTCWGNDGDICDDAECEHCKGTGSCDVNVTGWKHSKVLASTVEEFILGGIKTAFRL